MATTGGGFGGSTVEVEEGWQTRRWSERCTCVNPLVRATMVLLLLLLMLHVVGTRTARHGLS
jgi:hypothetical protein